MFWTPYRYSENPSNYVFGISVKKWVSFVLLAPKSDEYSLRSLLVKIDRFFRKIDFFRKKVQKSICASRALDIKTTAGTLDGRIGPNPLTWRCAWVFSEPSGELSGGRERDNDPAHMWHIIKNWKKCDFLLHIDLSLHRGILILHSESSKCENFEIIGIYAKF